MSNLSAIHDRTIIICYSVFKLIDRCWKFLRHFGSLLLVAWPSTTSVFLGVLIFWLMPQAHDLFLDFRGSSGVGALNWSFYLQVHIFFWTLAVFLSAKYAIEKYSENHRKSEAAKDSLARIGVPVFLGALTYFATILSLYGALYNLHILPSHGTPELTKYSEWHLRILVPAMAILSARFLLIGFCCERAKHKPFALMALPNIAVIIFFLFWLTLIVFWYFPLSVPNCEKDLIFSSICGREFGLGASALFTTKTISVIGTHGVGLQVFSAFLLPTVFLILPTSIRVWWHSPKHFLLALGLFITFSGLFVLTQYSDFSGSISPLQLMQVISFAMFVSFGLFAVPVLLFDLCRLKMTDPLLKSWGGILLIAMSLFFVLLLFASVFIAHGFTSQDYSPFYRARLFPVVLGAWVPLITILTVQSRRLKFPFVISVVFAGAFFVWLLGDIHKIRTLESDGDFNVKHRSVARFLEKWRAANDCADGPCKTRPIIVAASGGGSRAAFFTASVLACLEDMSRDAVLAKSDQNKGSTSRSECVPSTITLSPAKPFSQQIFAISAVSGSSVGSAMMVATLSKAAQASRESRPCRDEFRPDQASHWFVDTQYRALTKREIEQFKTSNGKKTNKSVPDIFGYESRRKAAIDKNKILSWRDCLQIITSNDFLSSTFMGIAYHDPFMFWLSPKGEHGSFDRAAILEESWEIAFCRAISDNVKSCLRANPLSRPFMASYASLLLQNKSNTEKSWLPLLVLNSTLSDTGQRLIISPFWSAASNNGRYLFKDAQDLHCFMATGPQPDACQLSKGYRDMRLSTAAGISARFPVISSHAVATGRSDTGITYTLRAVDGGYFENYGAISALEIIKAIDQIDNRLKPLLLLITNEPNLDFDRSSCGRNLISKLQGQKNTVGVFTSLWLPLKSVLTTRTGRGRLAATEACDALGDERFFHIRVFPADAGNNTIFRDGNSKDITKRIMPCIEKTAHVQGSHSKKNGAKMSSSDTHQYRELSASWWLSQPVQQYLDGQLRCEENIKEIDRLFKARTAK